MSFVLSSEFDPCFSYVAYFGCRSSFYVFVFVRSGPCAEWAEGGRGGLPLQWF